MDQLHQTLQVFNRARREHPVAEVEDVPRPAASGLNHPPRGVLDHGPGPEQQRRIQVSLDSAVVADHPPGLAQLDPPVHANHIPAPPPAPPSPPQSTPITPPPASRINERIPAVPVAKWIDGAPARRSPPKM